MSMRCTALSIKVLPVEYIAVYVGFYAFMCELRSLCEIIGSQ